MTVYGSRSESRPGEPGATGVPPTVDDLLAPCVGQQGAVNRPDGTKLRTVVAGEGPTVVLVHGFGMSADAWNLVQIPLVAAGCKVLAYDQRGHGRSTFGSEGLTSMALWRDFAALMEACDISDAVVVCHSMGNFVGLGALGYWTELQPRVRAIVCVSPVTGHAIRGAPTARLQVPLVRIGLAQCIATVPKVGRKLARANLGANVANSVVEATRLALARVPRSLAPLASMLARESIASALPAIHCPTTILTGMEDKLTPRWHADLIAECAPQAVLTSLPVGHMVNWEMPQAIVGAVLDSIGQRV